jgi:TonB family protein
MKGPSLQKTTAVSAALHATLFLITILVLKHSSRMTMPSPYVVNLVSPGGSISVPATGNSQAESPEPASIPKAAEMTRTAEKIPQDTKADRKRLEDSLHALEAKKKLEKLASLKQAMRSVKGSDQTGAAIKISAKTGARSWDGKKGVGQGGELTYANKVRSEIWEQWKYPDAIRKNYETVVSVKIFKDGVIRIQEIEKKSGDRFFDKHVLKAIELASPVTPPPYEMELGIRFSQ